MQVQVKQSNIKTLEIMVPHHDYRLFYWSLITREKSTTKRSWRLTIHRYYKRNIFFWYDREDENASEKSF